MKLISPIIILLGLSISISAFADDTIIYNPTVSLDTSFSHFDNVEVFGHKSITLQSGFTYSSSGNGSFCANADPWMNHEPDGWLPPGNQLDSSGNLDGSYVVGSIKGKPGVSPSGAATYHIPIEVPPGNKGMVPQLSLNYNSQGGNGILGRGWSLGGVSSIVATGKNRYFDKEFTSISSTDTACRVMWDGQRLIALNSAGLAADSFRTEGFSNHKIERFGSDSTMWFKIRTPDGRTLEYGNSTDSRLALDDNTQWKWMLSKVYDRNGNTIVYSYDRGLDIGKILISKVEYGGSTGSPVNRINFHYKGRDDIRYAYVLDNLVLGDQILDSISIHSNGGYFGSYALNYSSSLGESVVSGIIQYDK